MKPKGPSKKEHDQNNVKAMDRKKAMETAKSLAKKYDAALRELAKK